MRTVILLIFLLAVNNAFAQWNYRGLSGLNTYHLTIDHDTVYASTDDGIYKKYANSTDTNWTPVGLQGFRVTATMFLDNQRMLCIFRSDTISYNHFVSISADRGVSYNFFYPGSVKNYSYFPGRFLAHSGPDTVYAASHGVKTYDGGQTWQPIGAEGSVVYVDPKHSNEVYMGSTTWISSVAVQYSNDYGGYWTYLPSQGFYPGDNHLSAMVVRGGYIYGSGFGVVSRKRVWDNQFTQIYIPDHNDPWQLDYRALDVSPVNDDYVYVSGSFLGLGANVNNSVIRLLVSADKGDNWDTLKHDPGTMTAYGINNMAIQRYQSEDIIWMGGTGIYTYSKTVPVSVAERENILPAVSIYPNPVTDRLYIDIDGHQNEKTGVVITNMLGQQVFSNVYNSGKIEIATGSWAKGYYQCTLNIEGERKTLKFVKL